MRSRVRGGCKLSGHGSVGTRRKLRSFWLTIQGFGARFQCFDFRVSGFGFSVYGFGVRCSLLEFMVWGLGFRGSGFEFRVWGFGVQCLSTGCGVSVSVLCGSGSGCGVSVSGFRASSTGCAVSGFGVGCSLFVFRVWSFGVRVRVVGFTFFTHYSPPLTDCLRGSFCHTLSHFINVGIRSSNPLKPGGLRWRQPVGTWRS